MRRNSKQLATALRFTALLSICFTFVMGIIGFIVFIKYPDLDPKYGLYHFLNTYFAPGLLGLMISGMLAVLMSTVDSWLNCTSSIVVKDFLRKIFPKMSDVQELKSARIATFVIAGIAMVIAIKSPVLMKVFFAAENFWHPVILIPFIAGIIGFKTSKKTFIVSSIGAVVGCVIAAIIFGELGLKSLAVGIFSNAVFFFGYHYFFVKKRTNVVTN
jgi:Na+/proline symporter